MARFGIFRKIGHALFPAIVPKRAATSKESQSEFRRGKASSAKTAEAYARRQRELDDDRRARAKAMRENKRARAEGIKSLDKPAKQSRKQYEAPYRQAWMEHRLSRPGRAYASNFEFFNSLPLMRNESEDVRQRLWRSYMDNIVSGHYRRDSPSNPFWRESGIHYTDFDWEDWRDVMGYGKK